MTLECRSYLPYLPSVDFSTDLLAEFTSSLAPRIVLHADSSTAVASIPAIATLRIIETS
jgi:hypothetical protein